tara:strand:+ start:879 stop:1085 length:207 start_codon:yes stop_codon:yes gene_type:complete
MTKEQAIKKLTETRILSTDLLEPLGISFETFLKFAQLNRHQQGVAIRNLIIKLQNESQKNSNKIYIWK